jgi:integrase
MSQSGFVRRRGETWTAYWNIETQHGEKQRTKGGFRTRKEAQGYLNDAIAAISAGVFAEPSKVTFGEFLTERWLPSREMTLRRSTIESYRINVNRHVLPTLGARQIQQVTVDHLDRLYTQLVKSGLSPKTVRNVHVLLHKALKDAVRKNLIARNPAEAADPPKASRDGREEMHTWTPAELRAFFEGLASHRLLAAYVLSATTGMRRGEVLGLRWVDIDVKRRSLFVNQTVLSVNYEVFIGQPKTEHSRRRVTLDPETVEVLLAHRDRQGAERRLLGADYDDIGLVFAREDGTPIHPDYFSQTFDRTVARLGLSRIRLHDLRHTHATLGLAAGIPVKVISRRLGHATAAFTQDVYMRVIPELEYDAADQIADLVFGTNQDDDDDGA